MAGEVIGLVVALLGIAAFIRGVTKNGPLMTFGGIAAFTVGFIIVIASVG